jgi:hypothetical protein
MEAQMRQKGKLFEICMAVADDRSEHKRFLRVTSDASAVSITGDS